MNPDVPDLPDDGDDTHFYGEPSRSLLRQRQDGPGIRDVDHPFWPTLELSDADRIVGLPACEDARVGEARASLLANLAQLVQFHPGHWLFYSRDNNDYVGLQGNVPRFYRRRIVVEAVASLQQAGLIEHQRTWPSPNAQLRSRIRASDKLIPQLLPLAAGAVRFIPTQLIVLRGVDGKPMRYRENAATLTMREEVQAHNAFLQQFEITLEHPDASYDEKGFVVLEFQRLDPTRKTAYRVFNGTLLRGGRWYGWWWQSLPSLVRKGLAIDGRPTREVDFRCCHLRLLCARAAVELPPDDAYAIPGLPRWGVKLAIQVMLNAPTRQSALGALRQSVAAEGGCPSLAPELMDGVFARFPELYCYWNTGYGLRLQYWDSQICANVQRRVREAGIPCLSVHDSFIVPEEHSHELTPVMDSEFENACARLRAKR